MPHYFIIITKKVKEQAIRRHRGRVTRRPQEGHKSYDLTHHCVKSVRIWSFTGPYFSAFGLNADQKNSEYGQFSCTAFLAITSFLYPHKTSENKRFSDVFRGCINGKLA